MKLLLSGLDTIECAYYLRPGSNCKVDFEALRQQKECIRQSKQPEAGVLSLGGMDFLLSPNGTKSGYPFLISNQFSTIQFGEFNDPSFFVKFSSLALWTRGAQHMHRQFLDWAASLGLVVRADSNLSHPADRILSRGWKPTFRWSAVHKCRCLPGSSAFLSMS